MSTVQLQMARLSELVDPVTSAGVIITTANVGMVDGDKFTKDKILDFYNQARLVLANNIYLRLDPASQREAVSQNVVRITNLQFASGVATKPTGYIQARTLMTAGGVIISIVSGHQSILLKSVESLANPIVAEDASTFRSENGSTYVPDASTYILRYYGITNFAISDVTVGSTVETFAPQWEQLILELAQAIALERGLADVNAMAAVMLGGK